MTGDVTRDAGHVTLTDIARDGLGLEICENMMFLIAGYNSAEMNSTTLPFLVGHTPAGSSSLNMIHYRRGHITLHTSNAAFTSHSVYSNYKWSFVSGCVKCAGLADHTCVVRASPGGCGRATTGEVPRKIWPGK